MTAQSSHNPSDRPHSLDTEDRTSAQEPIVIKKYANRRLYNTQDSSYVTLENLCKMSRAGINFVVRDAKSGKDLTRAILTQVILDAESRSGHCMLPEQFMRDLISFYGTPEEWMVRQYLRDALDMFRKKRSVLKNALSTQDDIKTKISAQTTDQGSEIATQNQQAMSVSDNNGQFEMMQRQLSEMQAQVEALAQQAGRDGTDQVDHAQS